MIKNTIEEMLKKQKESGNLTKQADVAFSEYKNDSYNRFVEGDLTKEITKVFNLRISAFQHEIINKLAKKQGKEMKRLIVDLLAEEAKKEGLFN